MTGHLYGIGVGPGDPELITLKAARLIKNADVIAYHSGIAGRSIARTIADSLISRECHRGTPDLSGDDWLDRSSTWVLRRRC